MKTQKRNCPSCGQKEGIVVETDFKKDSRDWVIGIEQKITKCSNCEKFHTMDDRFNLILYNEKL